MGVTYKVNLTWFTGGLFDLQLTRHNIHGGAVATAPLVPVSRAVTRHHTLRGLHHVICAMVTDHVKSAIIKALYLSILDQSFGFLDDLVVYSWLAHLEYHPVPGYYLYLWIQPKIV
jgi:hypothetical protein